MHSVTGETQRKNSAEQYSLNCVLIFIAPVQTVCGGLTVAGWLPDSHPAALSLLLLNKRGGENKLEKSVGRDREIT